MIWIGVYIFVPMPSHGILLCRKSAKKVVKTIMIVLCDCQIEVAYRYHLRLSLFPRPTFTQSSPAKLPVPNSGSSIYKCNSSINWNWLASHRGKSFQWQQIKSLENAKIWRIWNINVSAWTSQMPRYAPKINKTHWTAILTLWINAL